MTARENMRQVLARCGAYRLAEDCPLQWELAAYGAGFDGLKGALAQGEQDAFALTASPERLTEWEALCLPAPAACGVRDRREMLAARLSLLAHRGPLTMGDLPTLLLAAGIRGTAIEEGGVVRVAPGEYLLPPALAQQELGRLMPLHLAWEMAEG